MDIRELAARAETMKQSGRYNCCQAVAAALLEQTNMTEEELCQLASGFCVGMGNMEATCGALIGAVMVAGLCTKGVGTVRAARNISESFKAKCGGAITCKALKGMETGKVLCPCNECVRNAVLAWGEVFQSDN